MQTITENFRDADLECGRSYNSRYADIDADIYADIYADPDADLDADLDAHMDAELDAHMDEDLKCGLEIGKCSRLWRNMISMSCTNLPFSELQKVYQDRYGIQSGDNNEIKSPQEWDTIDDVNNNNNNPDLDHDATEEILRRLPMPSLMRAKSICKAWNTAISATNFNLNNEGDNFLTQQTYQGIAFFCASLNKWFQITWNREKGCAFHLSAAAAGLFLFHHLSGESVIYNVLTKQRRFLPSAPVWTHRWAVELMVQADHFEIFTLNFYDIALLYDSSTDQWKDIRADFIADQIHEHHWTSTLHNGIAYFTCNFGRHLVCYDFGRREFHLKEIEGGLPPKIDNDDYDNNCYTSLPCLVSCKGKLLLVGRLAKEAGDEGSIWGGIPFIKHSLVGIWVLENSESWSLLSVTPHELLKDTIMSSHGTDFMVAASSNKIWLTIKGSKNVLTLDLMSMEWSVWPGYTGEDLVDTVPRRAFFVPFSTSPSLILAANPPKGAH
ncbi:hypothetical protein SUGI_1005450 [Cryptomeria japonica]|nr:hypothetical protein SUGI_1005450 [Cryptomeria japonica]